MSNVDATAVFSESIPAAYTAFRFPLLVPCPLPRDQIDLWTTLANDTYAITPEGQLTRLLYFQDTSTLQLPHTGSTYTEVYFHSCIQH